MSEPSDNATAIDSLAKQTPDLSVVICDFNGWTHTRQCLAALSASTLPAANIILIDHGTTDATAQGMAREFPDNTRVQASPQLWWAGATNVGIRLALRRGSSRIMLLNNDCILEPDALETLILHAAQAPDAIIAPVQRDAHSGTYIAITPRENLLLGFATLRGPQQISAHMRAQRLINTRLIGGGRGVIFPARVFSEIGLLDEINLPHYYADHDLYLRCRKTGIRLLVAMDAEVKVDNSQTSSAYRLGTLTPRQFLKSLTDMRSHRSIRHLKPLFAKHYPIPRCHWLGVGLYVARSALVYLWSRVRHASGQRQT